MRARTPRTSLRSILLAGLSAALLAGCGTGALGDDGDGTGAGGKADGVGEEAPPPTLASHYGLWMTSTVTVRAKEDGEVTSATTEIKALVRTEQVERDVTLEVLLCDAVFPEIAGRLPSVEPALFERVTPAFVKATIVSGAAGPVLASEHGALLLGIDPADPVGEALPTDGDDPRVVDLDADGKPGISIKVSGFSIYGGVRALFGFEGPIADDGGIAGEASIEIELSIFGDNIPFVNAAKEFEEAQEEGEVIGQKHRFTLAPLLAGGTTCDDVKTLPAPAAADPEAEPETDTDTGTTPDTEPADDASSDDDSPGWTW